MNKIVRGDVGIYKDNRSGTWVARSRAVKGKRTYLGAYKTPEDALKAFSIHEQANKISQSRLENVQIAYEPKPLNLFSRFTSLCR